jgi:LemA protein
MKFKGVKQMKKSSMGIIIVIALIVIVGLMLVSSYNSIVAKSEEVDNKYATIDTYLQRRADLIPNLVNTVKGYTKQEQDIINSITDARAKMVGTTSVSEKAEANDELTSALNKLMVVVENYPDLKSSQNFIQLSDELSGTENRIATARKDYNDAVKEYNLKIKKFPAGIIANMFGFEQKEYFQATQESKEVPNVQF